MTNHPIPNGTRVRLLPKEGTIERANPFRLGRTKETAETKYSYLVRWSDGTMTNMTPDEIETIEEEQKGACSE